MKSVALALTLLLWFGGGPASGLEIRSRTFTAQQIRAMQQTRALIQTRLGDIEIRFFPEKAPNHVANFIQLARSGFYDGTTFHRVISGFVIQGGDPNTKNADRSDDGKGGPGYYLKAEFSDLPHRRGTVSMARSRHPDSAGSQFFICVQAAPQLDGKYTVFGQVVKGMNTVDRIVAQPTDRNDNPVERIEMRVSIQGPF